MMEKCKHENYQVKRVMDFVYSVCECGFQWRGFEPCPARPISPFCGKKLEEVNGQDIQG